MWDECAANVMGVLWMYYECVVEMLCADVHVL